MSKKFSAALKAFLFVSEMTCTVTRRNTDEDHVLQFAGQNSNECLVLFCSNLLSASAGSRLLLL